MVIRPTPTRPQAYPLVVGFQKGVGVALGIQLG